MTAHDAARAADARIRVALVTGVANELGRAAARRLARDGLAVALCDAPPARLEALAAEIGGTGGRALAVEADVTDDAQVRNALLRAVEWHGRIDVLVNCAGAEACRSWDETDPGEWEGQLRASLTSTFLCCRWAASHMKTRRYGKIVNVAASAGRYRSSYFHHTTSGRPRLAYASAHGGVLALTRELAFEVARDGIYVNAVVPGMILTAHTRRAWSALPEDVRRDILAETALGRLGHPDEVAGAIGFLASDAASYVTGTALDVNGGWWMS